MSFESEMTQHLFENLRATAIRRWLLDKIANPVGIKHVAPPNHHLRWLLDEFGLMEDRQGEQPVRVLEGHQSAAARLAFGEDCHEIEECDVSGSHREGQPHRIGHVLLAEENLGIAEIGPTMGNIFQSAQDLPS